MSWSYLPERAPEAMNGRHVCANKYQCLRTVKRPGLCLRCKQAQLDGGYVNDLMRRGISWRDALDSWRQYMPAQKSSGTTRRRAQTDEN